VHVPQEYQGRVFYFDIVTFPYYPLCMTRPRRTGYSGVVFVLMILLYASFASAVEPVAEAPAKPPQDDYLSLQPYKPLYALAVYDTKLHSRAPGLQDGEMQFQISFRVPLLPLPFFDGKLHFGYTQVSYWQIFNNNLSSPFRETDYAPELMARFEQEKGAPGATKSSTVVGLIHQSNGKGLPDSRSWNRLYVEEALTWDRFTFVVKPWYRLPEPAKQNPSDPKGDDNPDIERYLGHGELSVEYRDNIWTIGIMARNNLRSPNYGAIQIDLSRHVRSDTKLYIQIFDGYGASLIDYNRESLRIGFGFMVERLP
jgi:phospholipase A1